jgi:three-Cys-motif partner protein
MVEKPYGWQDGAILEEHSKRKHKILREYFSRYMDVRCQLPQRGRFRLAVAEGFSGAGRYRCGSPGSPLIFIEELKAATDRFNIRRSAEGLKPIEIECLLLCNDADPDVTEL